MEFISVVVPVYNRAEIFYSTLESIALQSYRPLQIIVVDDGSTENMRAYFEKVSKIYTTDECTFLYIRQENKGAPAARNHGLAHARGEFVIFWDADVTGEPYMLQEMYDALCVNPEVSFVYSNFYFGNKLMRGKKFSPKELYKVNFITTTSLIRKNAVVAWDESLKRFQDWDLWLTMTREGKRGIWIDKTLFRVALGGTISSWLPSFAYMRPFRWLPGFRSKVMSYEHARQIILHKHLISD